MGMVFTDDVTDHTGRFFIRLVPVVTQFAHGEQYAPVYGLKPVTHIRQGTPHDDTHGVVQIGLLELIFNIYRENLFGNFSHGNPVVLLLTANRSRSASIPVLWTRIPMIKALPEREEIHLPMERHLRNSESCYSLKRCFTSKTREPIGRQPSGQLNRSANTTRHVLKEG